MIPLVAWMINELVGLYNRKFTSWQGLPPDFGLGLYFHQGQLEYGIYTPILGHFGGADHLAFYEPDCLVPLPWPHELTAEHLKI